MASPLCWPSDDFINEFPMILQPMSPPASVAIEARPNAITMGNVLVEEEEELASETLSSWLLLSRRLPPKSAPKRIQGVANWMDNPCNFREVIVPPGERTPTLAKKKVIAMAVTGAPRRRPTFVEFPTFWATTPTAERVARLPQESSAPTMLRRSVVVVVVVPYVFLRNIFLGIVASSGVRMDVFPPLLDVGTIDNDKILCFQSGCEISKERTITRDENEQLQQSRSNIGTNLIVISNTILAPSSELYSRLV